MISEDIFQAVGDDDLPRVSALLNAGANNRETE
jgi:hypothetical protein